MRVRRGPADTVTVTDRSVLLVSMVDGNLFDKLVRIIMFSIGLYIDRIRYPAFPGIHCTLSKTK